MVRFDSNEQLVQALSADLTPVDRLAPPSLRVLLWLAMVGAVGLIVAIIGLIGYAVLNGKTQALEDDINEASVQVLNLVVSNRQKVNLAGVQG